MKVDNFVSNRLKNYIQYISVTTRPPQVLKINTDDSSLGNPGPAGAGGLIRDHNGSWICGFSQNVGFASSVLAEHWALKDGLSLVTSVGFSNVLIKLDAPVAPSFNQDSIFHPWLMNIVDDCRSLLLQISNYRMSHIFHEGNKCADAMARLGGSLSPDFVLYSSPPNCIKDMLSFDLYLEACLHVALAPGQGFGFLLFYQKKKHPSHGSVNFSSLVDL